MKKLTQGMLDEIYMDLMADQPPPVMRNGKPQFVIEVDPSYTHEQVAHIQHILDNPHLLKDHPAICHPDDDKDYDA